MAEETGAQAGEFQTAEIGECLTALDIHTQGNEYVSHEKPVMQEMDGRWRDSSAFVYRHNPPKDRNYRLVGGRE